MASPTESELEQLKVTRRQRKAAIKRHVGTLRRLVAEENFDGVEARLRQIADSFQQFEASHDAYNACWGSANLEESDNWFLEVEQTYTTAVTEARAWLKSVTTTANKPESRDSDEAMRSSLSDLVHLMSIPKVELETFSGNPIQYQSFVSVFDEVVHRRVMDDQLKLTRLLQYTAGPAKEAIRSCAMLGGSVGYRQAREILMSRFGDPNLVARRIIDELRGGKPVNRAMDLQQLTDELSTAFITLGQLGFLGEINTQESILGILQRCRPYVKSRWRDRALKTKADVGRYPNFGEFVEFVKHLAVEACDPVYGSDSSSVSKNTKVSNYNMATSDVATCPTGERFNALVEGRTCVICGRLHNLFNCEMFKGMSPKSRFDAVYKHKLCFNCLLPDHISRECPKVSVCSVPGCGRKHSKFIHLDKGTGARSRSVEGPVEVNSNVSISQSVSAVYLPIVPVIVNGLHMSLALLDTGSTNTFMTERLASNMKLKGSVINYNMNTLSGSDLVRTRMVSVKIESADRCNSIHLHKVLVVPSIPVRYPNRAINMCEYPHLKDLPMQPISQGAQVDLLIGMDNSNLLLPLEIRFNPKDTRQPYATLTTLGWVLNGSVGAGSLSDVNANFVQLSNKCDDGWVDDVDESEALSHNDRRVIQLWENEIQYVNGHYSLPIPWREGRPNLPNNKSSALARLKSLLKRLHGENMFDKYGENISKLVDDGYAEPVPLDHCARPGELWYLPHHAVLSESKPGKVRIVFDCAATYRDMSLNNQCLQGPDLNNKLLHVLLRFRQYPYAVMADIEAMYHQVKIPLKDRDTLRFLWFEDDNLIEYRMTSHLFGGVWCASSSTFALRMTVNDFPTDDSVKYAILKSFYVDDLLHSVKDRSKLLGFIRGCRDTLASGGFNLTKFVLNDKDLLSNIDMEHRAKEVRDIIPSDDCKALGIKWDVSQDILYYVVKPISCSGAITKRYMLSQVNSLYDPLGLVSPVTLLGRLLFQESTRLKLGWDDPVPLRLASEFQAWLLSLDHVSSLHFPRCVMPMSFEDGVAELHHFCDASESGYGACSYIRVINRKGEIHVMLLASKARLCPLKPVTTPRLELMAAVTGATLDQVLGRELNIPLLPSTFWTDSQICLSYIRNDAKRFKVFVANRVSLIRRLSAPDQWRHVTGVSNPADILSRGCNCEKLPKRWLSGPTFLSQYKSSWIPPLHTGCELLDNDAEVKGSTCGVAEVTTAPIDPIELLIEHYSSFYKLKKAICYLTRFKNRLRKQDCATGPITVDELSEAERVLVCHVQSLTYPNEIAALRSHKSVLASSSISSLSPFLYNGMLAVGGRLKHATIRDRSKYPYILPVKHRLSRLIVADYHGRAHLGTEWTLSHLRENFWITRVRGLTKEVKRNCVTCKRLYGKTSLQKMGDLLPEQCEPNKPPFTYVGVDLFGPFYVKYGRSTAKRYGCIFTCLTTRAVHLEVLVSLETDAFINGLIRFISRRGCPIKVWSDNGTNLVGGRRELSNCLKHLDRSKVIIAARRKMIDWSFNPPLASHKGGLWERMIRTVRKVLMSLLYLNNRLTDEVLRTVFCEVESIVNSRPLTKLSEDTSDDSPLTPNHLLLLRENFPLPWGIFQNSDTYRKRWRQVQHLSNQFWHRWLRQYLPDLQVRQKWRGEMPNFQRGDLVLVMDVNTPRGSWPLGVVEEVNYGRDKLVRSVKLRTATSVLVRPVTKLVALEGVHSRN